MNRKITWRIGSGVEMEVMMKVLEKGHILKYDSKNDVSM